MMCRRVVQNAHRCNVDHELRSKHIGMMLALSDLEK